jgi:phage terminase small subunit
MPILSNPRHERFAQELAKGKSATEAMEEAGFKDPRNSTRLTKNDEIRARVAELQERGAARTETTVAGITERLKSIADKAEALGDAPGFSVARAAMVDVAKINGLVIERTENVHVVHDVTDEPLTEEEWAAEHPATH